MTGAEAQQSHSSQLGKDARLQLDFRVIWRTQPGKAELHFQFMPMNRICCLSLSLFRSLPPSLSLCILTLSSFHTTAKSIEMTTQLEGHSQTHGAV